MELDSWAARSQWYQPLMNAEEMASVLGVRPQSVRQYMSTVPGFPRPAEETRGRFIAAQFYDYLRAERPQLQHRIPRLCPLGKTQLRPARFLRSEICETARRHKAVLHYWQPDDDRGPLVVAYCESYPLTSDAQDLAQEIAQLHPGVSAVVAPSLSASLLPDPWHPDDTIEKCHRAVAVAQPGCFDEEFDGKVGWLDQFSWSDLANLLRVDVPYWPLGLRDLEAMQQWRPGQVFSLAPRVREDGSTSDIWHALESSCSSTSVELTSLLHRVCRYTDYTLAVDLGLLPGTSGYGIDNEQGYLRAAVPKIADSQPQAPSAHELAQLLHMRINPRYSDGAICGGDLVGLWDPVITGVTILDTDQLVPLGRSWLERLQRRRPEVRREFGFIIAMRRLREYERENLTFWSDPINPHCWIVRSETAIHVTQSPAIPAAQGILTSVEIGPGVGHAFMSDSAGNSWLMPCRRNGEYGVGNNGSTPRSLTSALEELLTDIRAPILRSGPRWVDGRDEPADLLSALAHTQPPLTLSRSQLLHLIDPTTAPPEAETGVPETVSDHAAHVAETDPAAPSASEPITAAEAPQPGPGPAVVFRATAGGQMVAIDARQFPGGVPEIPLRFHDFEGNPISREQWEQLFTEDPFGPTGRLIGSCGSGDHTVQVRTVWTGVSIPGGGETLIFHTNIAGGDFDGAIMHYRSAAQAHVGHTRTLSDLQEQRVPWFLVTA
ncbi:hypothetical protein [Mycobacteroides salmoniphilum]|uniref:hypothetical protein n=1 Tax=Mycobacteroides salmoniphilum TaxID=404941 RepID=UPI00106568C4|nr:hypothetical protein [Mycobacteroides salmoniphilum]